MNLFFISQKQSLLFSHPDISEQEQVCIWTFNDGQFGKEEEKPQSVVLMAI